MSKASNALNQLLRNGFVQSSPRINHYLYKHPMLHIRTFRFQTRHTSENPKHSSIQLFGSKINYVVLDDDASRKAFALHLYELFKAKNPKPTIGMRTAFTKVLHEYNIRSPLEMQVA